MVARTMTEAERWLERHTTSSSSSTWTPGTRTSHGTRGLLHLLLQEDYAGEQLYPCYGKWEEAGLTKDDVDLAHATYCGEVTMVNFWIGGCSPSSTRWGCGRTRWSSSPRPRLLLRRARLLRQGRVGTRAGGPGHGGLVSARVAGRVVALDGESALRCTGS